MFAVNRALFDLPEAEKAALSLEQINTAIDAGPMRQFMAARKADK